MRTIFAIAVAAHYVDLFRRPDDSAVMGANVLDATILRGLPPALDGRGGFLAVRLGLDLEQRLAAGGNVLHTGLLGQPFCRFVGQRRYRPAIGGMMLDVQTVGFGCILEFLVVVIAVVAYVLDAVG